MKDGILEKVINLMLKIDDEKIKIQVASIKLLVSFLDNSCTLKKKIYERPSKLKWKQNLFTKRKFNIDLKQKLFILLYLTKAAH